MKTYGLPFSIHPMKNGTLELTNCNKIILLHSRGDREGGFPILIKQVLSLNPSPKREIKKNVISSVSMIGEMYREKHF
jgi:hypothetical protein